MAPAPAPSILLVEDSSAYAHLVTLLLEEAFTEGVDVRHHATLAGALDDLAGRDADCIVLDLGLPDAHGVDGVRRIVASGAGASIVVLTGNAEDSVALAALEAGAQDVLSKGDEQAPGVLRRAIRYAIERTRAQRREADLVRAGQERFQMLADAASVGIFETDATGACIGVNPGWRAMSGLSSAASLGRGWIDAIHPEDREQVIGRHRARQDDHQPFIDTTRLQRPDGSVVWVQFAGQPLRGADGTFEGYVGTATDITATVNAAAEMRAAEERFRHAFEDAPIGMGLVDLEGAWLRVNRALARMVGRSEHDLVSGTLEELTHPGDRGRDSVALDALMAGRRSIAVLEQRLVHADGSIRRASISMSLVRDHDGQPLYAIAHIEDVTESRDAQEEVERQQLDMLAIAALSREAATAEDPRDTLVRGARRVLGADHAVLYEPAAASLVPASQAGSATSGPLSCEDTSQGAVRALVARERVELAAAGGIALFEPVLRGAEVVGVLALTWSSAGAITDRRRTASRMFSAELAAAIEHHQLLGRLRELARTDPLTGLANRRAWDERVALELARAERGHGSLAVAMLDLDRFKAFNDTHGHQAGDRLLRTLSAGWQRQLRGEDLLARLGGDEFALLLPDCTPEEAQVLVERLRTSVPPEVACSAGLIAHQPGDDGASLVTRADRALYEAKAAGRGRTSVAD